MNKSITRKLLIGIMLLAIIVVAAITVSQCNELADEPGPTSAE